MLTATGVPLSRSVFEMGLNSGFVTFFLLPPPIFRI